VEPHQLGCSEAEDIHDDLLIDRLSALVKVIDPVPPIVEADALAAFATRRRPEPADPQDLS
jgi:hypothetical protein